MAYNTVDDIKRYLNLESADQTISDADITLFLADANDEVFSQIKRKEEVDYFRVGYTTQGVIQDLFNLAVPVETMNKVSQNGTELAVTTEYTLDSTNKNEVTILATHNVGDTIKVQYIPIPYKKAELYECLMMLRARMNPFSEEGNDPIYLEYKGKRDIYYKILKGKLNTGRYT